MFTRYRYFEEGENIMNQWGVFKIANGTGRPKPFVEFGGSFVGLIEFGLARRPCEALGSEAAAMTISNNPFCAAL
jgi:hypothetical protein